MTGQKKSAANLCSPDLRSRFPSPTIIGFPSPCHNPEKPCLVNCLHMNLSKRLLLAALCFSTLPLPAQTEIGGAALNGTVTDPSGSVVVSAKVSVRNPDNGLARTSATSNAGLYSFRLPVGAYDVTVESTGFKKTEYKRIELTVGSVVTLDVVLQVGSTSETVDVTAEAPVIETTRTSTSTGVNARSVADLPINGRNFIDFTVLTPGVVKDPSRGGDLSFGGQRGPACGAAVHGCAGSGTSFAEVRQPRRGHWPLRRRNAVATPRKRIA